MYALYSQLISERAPAEPVETAEQYMAKRQFATIGR